MSSWNQALGRAFVRTSASCCWEGKYTRFRNPEMICCLIKWQSMSTCLVLLLAVGLVASCIADLFSHNTIMDGMEISNERWLLIQSSSLVACKRPVLSHCRRFGYCGLLLWFPRNKRTSQGHTEPCGQLPCHLEATPISMYISSELGGGLRRK